MKILFIAPRYHTNQIPLVKKLIDEGHEVEFFVMGIGNSEDYSFITPRQIKISSLTTSYLKIFRKNLDISKFSNIAIPKISTYVRMVYEFKPDVVILRGGLVPMYSFIIFPFLLIKKIKVVFYSQRSKLVSDLGLSKRIFDYIISRLFSIKWYTPVLYRAIDRGRLKDLKYIDYVPFFVDSKKVQIEDRKEGFVNFLCVAKYEPRKNIGLVVKVIEKLQEKYVNFNLTIIGSTGNDKREAYFESIRDSIQTKGLSKKITILKNVPFKEMEKYYLSNNVFLMPSINESASVSQLEAMSYGLGIICSSDNGTAHYIQDGRNGFIIDVDISSLTIAMEKYLNDINLVTSHRSESLKIIKNDFSIEQSYSKFITVLTT